MFSLSLNPTKHPTEYWNNGLQLLMMHKYFSSQHFPFHNYIHEAPRSSSPFIIYLLYFTLPSPQRFLKIHRTWTQHLNPSPAGSSTSPSSPQSQIKHSPCTEGAGSWWRMDCDQLNTLKTDPATEGTECPKGDTSASTPSLSTGQPRAKCSSPAQPIPA